MNKNKYIPTYYPIISNYNYNNNKISIELSNIFSKSYINDSIEIKRKYITYDIIYDYDKIGKKNLCALTHFIKLLKPHNVYQNGKYQLSFDIDIMHDEHMDIDNINLKNFIIDVITKIKDEIIKLHPNITPNNINLPYHSYYCAKNDNDKNDNDNNDDNKEKEKRLLSIGTIAFRNKIKNNFMVNTPIYFHKSKNKGGGVVIINNENNQTIKQKIITEMPLFKNRNYGITTEGTNDIHKDIHKDIHYEGKFTLLFNVNIVESESIGDKQIYCDIKVFAKEIEIKHNVSYINSVLEKELTYINETKNDNKLKLLI